MTVSNYEPVGHRRGDDQDAANSVGKAVTLLFALGEAGGAARLTDLVMATGLAKSTVHRVLAALEAADTVRRDGKTYRLSHTVFELGNRVAFCQPGQLREVANPHLGALLASTGGTVALSILSGRDVLFLEKLSHPSSGASPAVVGSRLPAHCCAPGKALLAYSSTAELRSILGTPLQRRTGHTLVLPKLLVEAFAEVHRTGLAWDREETGIGRACIATPILRDGRAVAAVSVSGWTTIRPERFAPELRRTARAIQAAMGAPATDD